LVVTEEDEQIAASNGDKLDCVFQASFSPWMGSAFDLKNEAHSFGEMPRMQRQRLERPARLGW
jgi:hypothetical protein